MVSLVGGQAINGGAYGCVFSPSLKCKDGSRHAGDGKEITKLMRSKYKEREYGEIQKYRRVLSRIPHYQRYFLISGYTICEPSPLTESDLVNFDSKCKSLTRMNITEKNVNENLESLVAMNMPYGGVELAKYMFESEHKQERLVRLNRRLCELFKFGVMPMNKLGVFHCDLKDNNILVDEGSDGLKTRVIDWGSAIIYDGHGVPTVLKRRAIAFNAPYSIILFNDTFTESYKEFLHRTPLPNRFMLRTFVIHYTMKWVREHGVGQLKLVNTIFKRIFKMDLGSLPDDQISDIIEYDYTYNYIYEYITDVLEGFTRDGIFQEKEYFSNIFLKNIDVWAFCVCYLPVIEMFTDKYDRLTRAERTFLFEWRSLFMYVLSCSTVPIDLDKFIKRLEKLGTIFSTMIKSSVGSSRRRKRKRERHNSNTRHRTGKILG